MKHVAVREGILSFLALAWIAASDRGAHGAEADPLPWVEGSTTLAVLPDTERYAQAYPDLFEAQTRWIRDEAEKRAIAFAIHLGDITQRNAAPEWEVARRCFALLDGHVPYALALGNHDYDGPDRKTRLSEYFPPAGMRKRPTFGGAFREDRLENAYYFLRIGDRDWLILVLELGPRDEIVAWANDVLERHRDRLAIIVTHAYLFRGNVRYDHLRGAQRASPHGWGNDGEELWRKLVRRHPNAMIVLSGHVSTGGTGYLASEGNYGNTVHQIMADYEKGPRGGSAYLRLLEFLPDGKTVQVKTFSPALDRYMTDPENQFTFALELPDRKTPKPVDPVASAPLSRPPIHRWSFDGTGGDGARILDSIGEAHAILRAEGTESRLNGKGQAVLAGDGRIDLPSGLLGGLEDITFEVWFAPADAEYRWKSAVRFGDGGDWLAYIFRTRTVHRAEIAVDHHNEDIQRTVPVEPEKTMHVVVSYDHDGADGKPILRYFRDGELFGEMPTGLALGDVTDTRSMVGPFPGTFDELRVYDYPLEVGEVRGSFAAGPDGLRGRASESSSTRGAGTRS
ncbi:MAG: metallophosphoesterase [Planctomycetes bacterium]|nr:metallophosphoesterase [Planctomycetota bacterium]